MESSIATPEKRKFERRVAPSKAPGRVLKKKLRDLERLLTKNDTHKTLPDEAILETKAKIEALKIQIQNMGPSDSANASPSTGSAVAKGNKNKKSGDEKKNPVGEPSSKGVKFTELRRAGRKISAFKKQNPGYEASESKLSELADLELDLLYIKHFPKSEVYLAIYPDTVVGSTDSGASTPLDSSTLKYQQEIRQSIQQKLAKGEIVKSTPGVGGKSDDSVATTSASTKTTAALQASSNEPASNWDSDEDEDEDDEEEEEEEQTPKKKSKTA